MIRRPVRAALATLVVALAVAGFGAGPVGAQETPTPTTTKAPTGDTTGAPKTPSGDPAIDDLVGCVQGSRKLLVLFLIDESASLQQTDPENRRVDAARGALDSLVALSTAEGGAAPQVDVALAAFSNDYRLVQDWTTVNAETAPGLNTSLSGFAKFNHGIDTDFVNALSAGRESLADQAAAVTADGGATPCRAVMLFTDGGYDIAVRTTEKDQKRLGLTKSYAPGIELTSKAKVIQAERMGRKALCDPGKLADRLRSDDVTLLTVALSGDVARRAQLPLAAATSGIADDYPCGTQPKAGEASRSQGAYLPAKDIDVLVTQFNGVGTRLAGGNLVPGSDTVKICGKDPCDEGTREFKLDNSLRRAQILTLAPKPGTVATVEGPNGETAKISTAGSTKVGGTTLTSRAVAGRGLVIDMARPADLKSWTGTWKVSITDPSESQKGDPAKLQIYVFSDIGIALGKSTPLERGAPTKIEAVLQLPKGIKAADVIASATAQARLRNPVTGALETVELKGPPAGPFTGTYNTPATTTSNALSVTVEARINTTGKAALVSQSPPTELLVRRPAGSVQFAPGSLKMPSLTGDGSTEVDMVLVGADKPGCVWFGKVDVPDPPQGIDGVTITSDDKPLAGPTDCIKVPARQQVHVLIQATPEGRASGTIRGDITVFEKVEGREKPTVTQVPFRFDQARGVDQAQRLFLSFLLLMVGLGLPMVALLIINAVTARFQSLDAVRGTAMPISVSGKSISRTDGPYPRPLSLREADFGSLATAGNDRSFTFGGVHFRAQASRNPFGATVAMAAPEGGAEKLKGRAGSKVELDPGLAGSWIFLLDSDKTRRAAKGDAEGLLLAFVAEGDINTQTNRMMPDITDRLPATASRLAGLVRQVKRKPPSKKKAGAAPTADVPADEEATAMPIGPSTGDEGSDEPVETAETPEEHDRNLPVPMSSMQPLVTPPPERAPEPEAPDDQPIALGAPDGAGEPIPLGAPDEPEVTDDADAAGAPEEPAAPSAPLGFGAARIDPVPSAPTADAGDDDDDGPSGPPVGFSGTRPQD